MLEKDGFIVSLDFILWADSINGIIATTWKGMSMRTPGIFFCLSTEKLEYLQRLKQQWLSKTPVHVLDVDPHPRDLVLHLTVVMAGPHTRRWVPQAAGPLHLVQAVTQLLQNSCPAHQAFALPGTLLGLALQGDCFLPWRTDEPTAHRTAVLCVLTDVRGHCRVWEVNM